MGRVGKWAGVEVGERRDSLLFLVCDLRKVSAVF